jgi:hypothetical protein
MPAVRAYDERFDAFVSQNVDRVIEQGVGCTRE